MVFGLRGLVGFGRGYYRYLVYDYMGIERCKFARGCEIRNSM